MNYTYEITPVAQLGTVVASGGTSVATGITWTDVYEPTGKAVVTVAANAAGAVVATFEQGSAAATMTGTLGTISAGTVAGVYSLDLGAITAQFVRATVTATGGTSGVTVNLLGKKRTIT
jgi:hypothetical protein